MGHREKNQTAAAKTRRSDVHNAHPANKPPPLAGWNQSAVNLTGYQQVNTNHYTTLPSRPNLQSQSTSQLVPPNGWLSTNNLNSVASPRQNLLALDQDASVRNVVGDQLSDILSLIDEETYTGTNSDIILSVPLSPPPAYHRIENSGPVHSEGGERRLLLNGQSLDRPQQVQGQYRRVNLVAKVSYYGNSRLPPTLPPFRAYISTYPLFCLAALCSANAYSRHQNGVENEQLIDANARIGTKAMVVKSVTCANDKTLVFAIRGTSVLSLRDWNVNLHISPESPAGFLDDDGNYCHSGFLRVARAMVQPIAARLRRLLEENPSRLSYSLLFTGHSAGGAVASLLYAHMLSQNVQSELTNLADCFRRIHCITFGAPPISLLPLSKPPNSEHKLKRFLFFSFINEGDPVVRAEKSYVMSLADLLTTAPSPALQAPAAITGAIQPSAQRPPGQMPTSTLSLPKITNLGFFTNKKKKKYNATAPTLPLRPSLSQSLPQSFASPVWKVPQATLSNAGRLVVLRGTNPALSTVSNAPMPGKGSSSQIDLSREFTEVRAFTVTDEELRKVIFGDLLMHAMDVYRRRIEALAMKAATGREGYY